MARRLLTALGRTLTGDPTDREPVHFHSGPTGDPAVCYERHCPNPKLAVHA